MSRLAYRAATRADLQTLVQLLYDDENGRLREDPSEPLDPGYTAAFEAIAADPNQSLVLATLDGATAGTMQLSFIPGLSYRGAWRCQIEAVRIAAPLRNRGLGAELIGHAIDMARARRCFLVQLASKSNRPGAHRFYERLGFAQSHLGFKLRLD